MKITRQSKSKSFLAAALGLCASSAFATTVPYTTALVSTFNPDESPTFFIQHSAPAVQADANYSKSGSWGNVLGTATANLGTGQLKVRAQNAAQSGFFPNMQVNAWFGDGFRANNTGGGPFNWLPNTGARFSLDLTGSNITSSDLLGNLGFGQVGAFVLLSLYQPGTLDPAGKLVGGANNFGYYLYLLGNPNQNLTYTDQQGNHQSLIPTAYYGDVTPDIHITQDFQPNGDFDWAVLVGAAGQIKGGEFYDMDLSHTLTVGYSGPAGSTTTAESGLFQNFGPPVPEPVGTMLAGFGVMMLLGRRRAGR